jgi:hypothetical protein
MKAFTLYTSSAFTQYLMVFRLKLDGGFQDPASLSLARCFPAARSQQSTVRAIRSQWQLLIAVLSLPTIKLRELHHELVHNRACFMQMTHVLIPLPQVEPRRGQSTYKYTRGKETNCKYYSRSYFPVTYRVCFLYFFKIFLNPSRFCHLIEGEKAFSHVIDKGYLTQTDELIPTAVKCHRILHRCPAPLRDCRGTCRGSRVLQCVQQQTC